MELAWNLIGHNIFANCSPHVRDSKTVLNSGFQAVDSRFQVMDSGFFPIVSGIPDSLSCFLDSKA